MNEPRKPGVWSRIGNGFTRARIILSNLFFFLFLLLAILLVFTGAPLPEVPDRGALVLDPSGAVVDKRTPVDPIQQWLTPQAVLAETEVTELLDALEHARDDDRIPMVVLDLDDLQFLPVAHANAVGAALAEVREAGKEVVAYGSFYDQQPYLLASYADAVYMHPLGQVMLPGYAIDQLYFKGLLERLNVNVHVFRAGRYKEFVEPYTRTDMSEDARAANQELVSALWERFGDTVVRNRQVEEASFHRYTQSFADLLPQTQGDMARLAVEYRLVDELLTPDQAQARIADAVGRDDSGGFNGIGFRDYLEAVNGTPRADGGDRKVGVITAEGPVIMGENVRGAIAAERIIKLIREARRDDSIGALVVRISTPGGSSFAAELIRQELELTQLVGKPVVVSMGPVAASGGYWIAATADEIHAEPTTLTGSIGVFGIVPTFEESLDAIGVNSDGVRTTALSQVNPLTPMSEPTAKVLQQSTESVYRRFVNLVARGRDMAPERVDDVAQGRVWIATRAQDLGLVDTLGGLDGAIARAAELAELEAYGVRRLQPALTPGEMLLRQLTGRVDGTTISRWLDLPPVLTPLGRRAETAWQLFESLDDPRHSYALCVTRLSAQ